MSQQIVQRPQVQFASTQHMHFAQVHYLGLFYFKTYTLFVNNKELVVYYIQAFF